MKNLSIYFLTCLLGVFIITGCDKDDDPDNPGGGTDLPIASFQWEVSADDFSEVSFENFSQNADSYAWDFGDNGTSTEKDPTYSYSAGGTYTVVLTATSGSETSTFSDDIEIVDPNDAAVLLNGGSSKTWKLFREGISMSLGPNADDQSWWTGLANNGERPCVYEQEFTFTTDGEFIFDDKGMYWGEYGIFNNVDGCSMDIDQACYDSSAGMFNACGDDVSAWAAGTHQYTYDPSAGELTLTGNGAWIGIPKLGTAGETIVPVATVTASIKLEEYVGYDLMKIVFDYGGAYWPITYVSYSDASLEPALETEAMEFGEDLPDISPTELFRTFASNDASDWSLLDTIQSGSLIEYGVDDPADASAAKVGLYTRVESDFQELQFQTAPDLNDINFENLSTISLDVYLPSSNTYVEGGLTKSVNIGIADRSQIQEWWNDFTQYENDGTALPTDEWVTLTYDITMPDNGVNPKERNNYDMFFISIGGSAHPNGGTFYVRNFTIN